MDYRDRLEEIFGAGKGPKSLRTIFDCDSTEWTTTAIDKKVYFLEKMLASGYSLENWIEDYQYQFQKTGSHIIKSIEKSISLIESEIENVFISKHINFYLKESPNRKIKEHSMKFLFSAYFNMREGQDVACIKRAYRDMNRTLVNFQVIEVNGKRDLKKIQENRKVVREIWENFLKNKILELKNIVFENNKDYDMWHFKFCSQLSRISSHRLTIGQAQKWINMTIKYLVVFADEKILKNIKYFHIPIDSLIMDELEKNKIFNLAKLTTPWSKIENWEEYLNYQLQFRNLVYPKPPLEMEFEIFNNILSRNTERYE